MRRRAMTYLVTGAAGQLGSTFMRRLRADGAAVTGAARGDLDLTDHRAVLETVARIRPSVILNCAAYNAVDQAEEDVRTALDVNAFAVQSLAAAAVEVDATLVHYSTDFVFDGIVSHPYTEEDVPNPRSVYGQSKLIGEWLAMDAPRAYVLRVESLFGGPAARSSIDRIIAALDAGQPARVFVDRVVTPSYTEDVVEATMSLLAREAAAGVYHCVNDGETTWLALADALAKVLGVEPRLVQVKVADVPMRAPRPQYCALSNRKLAAAGASMPSWQDAIARYAAARADRRRE